MQRHRLALLALLALTPGRRISRDKLLALLWPDADAERGRNLLNVSLYTVRKTLGDAAIATVADDLRLDPDAIDCDVAEFSAAIEAGDFARAVALYRGPLLDGFFIADSAIDPWVEQERQRLAGDHGRALEALAEAAEAAGEHARAVDWWRTRAATDPLDSRVALRLMEALDASGNRAGALQLASVHERLLVQELGEGAMPLSIRARVAQLRRASAPAAAAAPAAPAPSAVALPERARGGDEQAPWPAGVARRRVRRAVATVAGLALSVAGVAWVVRAAAPRPERSIVVLPFVRMSASPDDAYLADGLTEEITTRLAAVPGLKVISRTSAMHYKGSQLPLRDIARELGVAQVLEGSVRRSDGHVRVAAQLIDATTDTHRWAESFEYDPEASFRVQEDIARAVAQTLETAPDAQARRQMVRRGTSSVEAYDLYQRGRMLWQTRTKEAHLQALELYARAIALDSSFADAYAGIADAYLSGFQLDVLGISEADAFARMKAAAERAIALDPESAAAHTSFGMVRWWERDWPGATRELERALDLNPGQATTRTWYSIILAGTGQRAAALREARRAYELDPFAVVVAGNLAGQCYVAGDDACANEIVRRVINLGGYANAYILLAKMQAQRGQPDSATAALRAAMSMVRRPERLFANLAFIQAKAGRVAEARESLRRAERASAEPFEIACAFVALHEPDSVFAWFDRTPWQWSQRGTLDDPMLGAVRSDPRFAATRARILREMGVR